MLQNKKQLGQNWLKDRAILEEIAESAIVQDIDPSDNQPLCLEIGPGLAVDRKSVV